MRLTRLYADVQFYDAAGVIKYDIFCSASGGAIKRDEVTVEGGGEDNYVIQWTCLKAWCDTSIPPLFSQGSGLHPFYCLALVFVYCGGGGGGESTAQSETEKE